MPLDKERVADGQEPLDGDGNGRVAGARQRDLKWQYTEGQTDRSEHACQR